MSGYTRCRQTKLAKTRGITETDDINWFKTLCHKRY